MADSVIVTVAPSVEAGHYREFFENALYVPRFGLEADPLAERAYCSHSAKDVIPVRTGREVRLGGSIHCLTWELSGRDAHRVLESQR